MDVSSVSSDEWAVEMVGAEGSPTLPLPRVSKQTGHSPSGASSSSGRPQERRPGSPRDVVAHAVIRQKAAHRLLGFTMKPGSVQGAERDRDESMN